MSPPLAELRTLLRTTIRSSGRILGNKYKGLYNVSGRGIPDISAQAFGFQIFVGGKEKEVYGTSGSTHLCVSWVVRPRAPDVLQVVAGIILNDFQFSDNRYTLCFLNPWLYGPAARLLDDIQNRTNPGCNIDGFCRRMGSCEFCQTFSLSTFR
ncbi:hypothetical protein EDB85DRAFT_2142652 [Lactarius pseudohatsudake]|nr:hypothetical protein EDB85DRAFT_2142652 [Lactarius pseudohatsudake]